MHNTEEAVVLHNKILKLQRPTQGTMEALRTYVRGARYMDKDGNKVTSYTDEKGNRGCLRPRQFVEESAADTMLERDSDFVSLHPPGDDNLGTKLAAKWFDWLRGVS
jgi:hypothetical protein